MHIAEALQKRSSHYYHTNGEPGDTRDPAPAGREAAVPGHRLVRAKLRTARCGRQGKRVPHREKQHRVCAHQRVHHPLGSHGRAPAADGGDVVPARERRWTPK